MKAPINPPAGTARLSGVLAPVLTPFDVDGQPSFERMLRHCRWLLDQGVGLAVFGTNSEANSLSVSEKLALLDRLVDAGIPPDRLLPGTGACALPDAVALTRHAVRLGCAGALMLPPFYYKGVSDEGLFRSFAEVIEQVGDDRLRIYLYHIPPVAQVGISEALIDRLMATFPRVIAGIKDSSGVWSHTASLLRRYRPRGLDVFAGNETSLLDTMRAGGAGCITATGNIHPGPIVALSRRWQDADAADAQERLNAVRAALQSAPMIAAMKSVLAWKTGDAGWSRVRPPLVELDAAQARTLNAALERLDFQLPGADMLALPRAEALAAGA
jgi:4-hydroxy-tetrahydrodipicolinate synthase